MSIFLGGRSPETNITPARKPSQKERIIFQPPFLQVQAVGFRNGGSNRLNFAALLVWLEQ